MTHGDETKSRTNVTCTICYSCSYIVRVIKEDIDVHCVHEELHTKVCWKTTGTYAR
jgi:hypothetical protein